MAKYVARYDNGTGYMEWASAPCDTEAEARAQLVGASWPAATDVIEVAWGGDEWVEVN